MKLSLTLLNKQGRVRVLIQREGATDISHLKPPKNNFRFFLGVVKNNPLLQPGRRHHNNSGLDNDGYSSDSVSCCSDSVPSDLGDIDDEPDKNQQNVNQVCKNVTIFH